MLKSLRLTQGYLKEQEVMYNVTIEENMYLVTFLWNK